MKELIINGVTVEMDEKTKMDLQFVSFLFTSINSISAPRSWTVSLPKSSINMGLIEGASSGDYSGDFPYNNYVVDYYNKGYRLINTGKGILTKIGSRIEFVFTFGKAFEKIKLMSETKLTELEETNVDFLAWNRSISLVDITAGFGWVNFYSFTNEDRTLTGSNADIPYSVLHPTVKFLYIMNKIQSFFGVTLVGLSTLIGGCSFPLRELEGVSEIKINTSSTANSNIAGITPNVTFRYSTLNYFSLLSNAFFTKNVYESEIVIENMDFSIFITPDSPQVATVKLCAIDFSGNVTVIRELDKTFVSGTTYHHTLTDYSFVVEKSYKSFYFAVSGFSSGGAGAPTLSFDGHYRTAVYVPQTSGGFYPIIPNLPDMTCADFLFQAMQLAGVFPEVSDETPDEINFYSADVLFDNIDIAKDWTNKLVKSTKRMSELSDVEFKFGSYAKKNTLAYKKDETNLLVTDDYLVVENANLEDESKLVDLKFAAGKRFSVSENTIDYPLYDIKIESGTLIRNPKSQSNDVLGKIVNISGINYLQFTDDLLWSNIKLTDNYAAQQTLLNKPRYIKENFYLKPEDVYNFSTKIPIYLQQYGKYYAVMKLQYRESEFSECELLELKNV